MMPVMPAIKMNQY